MFRIADGREQFYQWDIDRQVIVDDPSIVEVHFCNRTNECSLCVDVVDGLADVPNIILQNSFDVRVFGYDGKATLHEKTFKVKPRSQPADYMYTETVVKSVEEVITAAEQVATITDEFYEFVDEYKLNLVDDGQGNVELKAVEKEAGDVDLDNYYTKEEVDALIEGVEAGDVDLSEYAKKTDIPDVSGFISSIPEEYVTDEELTAKGYLTEHQSLDGKADKVHSHPEYITEHQSLAGYATETYVANAINTAFAGIATAEGGSY